jgi:hypothetical protein
MQATLTDTHLREQKLYAGPSLRMQNPARVFPSNGLTMLLLIDLTI